jgi:uncharacterized protein (TIGR02757 family)
MEILFLMNRNELKSFLDEKYIEFNNFNFIDDDPVKIPHEFSCPKDIEIAGLFASVIAWGNRKSIIKNGYSLIQRMDNTPSDFIRDFNESDLKNFTGFKHRTFNEIDLTTFCYALQNILTEYETLGLYFKSQFEITNSQAHVLSLFKNRFFQNPYALRSKKHLPDPLKGSAAKRICMYFRWMVRKDKHGVDLGIWNKLISPSILHLPLDIHTSNVGRALGLLNRKQNDWRAVEEITTELKKICPEDPIKYDFSLFGLGVNEGFK